MIDIQTLMLALGVGNIAFAVLMAGYTRSLAANPSLNLWMWARLTLGAAQMLGWLAPYLALPALMALAPIGWVAGVVLEVAAYCMFFGFPCWQRVLYPTAGLALLLVVSAGSVGASAGQMTVLTALIIALFAGGMAGILLRPRGQASLLQRVIGVNDAVFAITMGLWAWTGTVHGGVGALAARPVLGFAYLAAYLLMIVNGFGFLLLCKQKDDAQMQRLAMVDSMTGLLNRRAFFEHAESARMLAARLRKPIALMMLDIDHFKELNDRFGHATGDEALCVFANTGRATLRDHDIMGRLGGEEFALVMPGTDLEGALQAAERVRLAVTQAPVATSGAGYTMTVSIGVVLIGPDEPLAAALARADHALYAAKSGGRNRVELGASMLKRA